MTPTTRNATAMMPKITAEAIRPVVARDPVEELTLSSC
jgi:hypothetical protein